MKITSLLLYLTSLGWSAGLLAAAAPPGSESVKLRITPERKLVQRTGPSEVVLEVELEGAPGIATKRSPLNVAFVIDRSGSMAGANLENAKAAVAMAVDRLQDTDSFSVVTYDDTAQTVITPQKVGDEKQRRLSKRLISELRPGGGTALYAGVQAGAKQVQQLMESGYVNRVILLSDGHANVGPQSPGDLADLGRELRKSGISVSTIGLGLGFNEDLMTGLAEASHANFYYVEHPERLSSIFQQELGAAASRIAAKLRLRIEVPEGVRLKGVLGHPEIKTDGRTVQIEAPEYFGKERRIYHLQCVVDESKRKDQIDLATAKLAYEDEGTKTPQAKELAATVEFTDFAEKSNESVRDEVARNFNLLQNRLANEEAIRLADQGRAKEAAQVLNSQISSNASAPVPRQFPGLYGENARMEKLANELQQQGTLSNGSRKDAQWNNYNLRNAK